MEEEWLIDYFEDESLFWSDEEKAFLRSDSGSETAKYVRKFAECFSALASIWSERAKALSTETCGETKEAETIAAVLDLCARDVEHYVQQLRP